jgi:hypothetical protein
MADNEPAIENRGSFAATITTLIPYREQESFDHEKEHNSIMRDLFNSYRDYYHIIQSLNPVHGIIRVSSTECEIRRNMMNVWARNRDTISAIAALSCYFCKLRRNEKLNHRHHNLRSMMKDIGGQMIFRSNRGTNDVHIQSISDYVMKELRVQCGSSIVYCIIANFPDNVHSVIILRPKFERSRLIVVTVTSVTQDTQWHKAASFIVDVAKDSWLKNIIDVYGKLNHHEGIRWRILDRDNVPYTLTTGPGYAGPTVEGLY